MYFAPGACWRRKASISSSLIMSSVPKPPGTQITSSCGQSAKVVVGVSISTESLVTGSIRFQIRCTFAPGRLENTCNGPVKSSWVTRGNSTRPICSGVGVGVGDGADIVTSGKIGLTNGILTWSLRVRNGIFPSFQDISQKASCMMIGVLVFPDFQLLDAAGPISAFEIAARYAEAAPAIRVLAVMPGPVRSSSGVEIVARGLTSASAITTLIVAGGEGVRQAATCEKTLGFVRAIAKRGVRSASFCSR